MRALTAIRTGQGRRWTFLLALLAAAIVFASGVGAASASDGIFLGSFQKKLQKAVDLCFSQGGGLDMDPPFFFACGFENPVSPDDAADAYRLCHGQLHGEFGVHTGEFFPYNWSCAYRPPKLRPEFGP
jgi:hypothetical protein